MNGNYYNGISFNKLADIYMFNARLRQILFPLIEEIEITLRCNISNFISMKYGNLSYENEENFHNRLYHRNLLHELEKEVKKSNDNDIHIIGLTMTLILSKKIDHGEYILKLHTIEDVCSVEEVI